MAVLLLADVNGGQLATDSVSKTLTAVAGLGDVHLLVAGPASAAAEAATLSGVAKVLHADEAGNGLAEGLADLIAAETEQQRRLALRQMQGGLKELYEGWRAELVRAGAHLEACIDFADEEIPDDLMPAIREKVASLSKKIHVHQNDHRRGEIVRDGFTIVILGAPNVGKSSLLNALARRDVAIVSPTPGTTRDLIEVHLDLGGYAVTVIDTAGLRDTPDEIEGEGIRRARARAEAADLRLAVVDGSGDIKDSRVTLELSAHDAMLINKADIAKSNGSPNVRDGVTTFKVSARTGQGIDELVAWLEQQVSSRIGGSESMPMTRARHRAALEAVTVYLDRFLQAFSQSHSHVDLLAEELRMAARELGRITGRIDVEDYLDVIFRDFCIGK